MKRVLLQSVSLCVCLALQTFGQSSGAPPNDGGALLYLNDTNPFGSMPLKGASTDQLPSQRQFQLKLRLDF